MAKYDSLTGELRNRLSGSKNILIALPQGANLDVLASGAALFLALSSQGKEVQIVSDTQPVVSQANLYGIGSIKSAISGGNPVVAAPAAPIQNPGGGDFTLVLENVATAEGTVPSLEKLDWYAENNNLNLVFHVLPGQSFNPTNVYPKGAQPVAAPQAQAANFDLVFVIGASNLTNLGNIYAQNQQTFSAGNIVNIDNNPANTSFGLVNVLDANTSSLSEIMSEFIPSLGLALDRDIATDLLAGIFEITANLTNEKVGPDTYTAVGNCVRVGGQKPLLGGQAAPVNPAPAASFGAFGQPQSATPAPAAQTQPAFDFSAFGQPATNPQPIQPVQPASVAPTPVAPTPVQAPIPAPTPVVAPVEAPKVEEAFTHPPVVPQPATIEATPQPQPHINLSASGPTPTYDPQPSPEERPSGERVVSESPEPGWLTPKVFKGSSLN